MSTPRRGQRLPTTAPGPGPGADRTGPRAVRCFVIGRARYGGRPVDHFPGDIKDVMAFDRALTGAEISGLLRP
ncbi:hypothetical protein ABZ690_27825 [Streptomyces sp. NPDC006967]|uniref:LamG domain-containing protein n=1 Tax=unclassified Streptomyces TaxID=2593676 RepID=UPI0011B0528C